MLFIRIICLGLGSIFLAAPLIGQTTPNSVFLANMRSDIDRLDQTVRALSFELESLRRENLELAATVKNSMQEQSGQYVTIQDMQAALRKLEASWAATTEGQRKTLISEVSEEIETLAEQTQKAINALAKSIEGQPKVEQVVVFNDNYPKSGTPYTVKRGDSLSRIARELNSNAEWIRNANRLSSDIIFPGQELFVPQKN